MLMMRRHEKDFMLRGDEKYGDELKQARRRVQGGELGGRRRRRRRPSGETTRTIGGISRFHLGQSHARTRRAEDLGAGLRPRPAAAGGRCARRRWSATRQERRNPVRQNMLAAIALTILVTVGCLRSLFGRRISRPLSAMARRMQQVARQPRTSGGPSRRDEIGAMSQAFAVFHQKMIENRALAQEQTANSASAGAERQRLLLDVAAQLEAEVGKAVEMVLAGARDVDRSAGDVRAVVSDIPRGLRRTGRDVRRDLAERAERGRARRKSSHLAERDRPTGTGYPRGGRAQARATPAHQRDRRLLAIRRPDRQRRRRHPRHRQADQPAGAERDHRGGAGGRSRARLCGGRQRSEDAGQPGGGGDGRASSRRSADPGGHATLGFGDPGNR